MKIILVLIKFLLLQCSTSFAFEFFELGSKRTDCDQWPKNVSKLPIECCSVPELFQQDIKDKCIANCTRPSEPSFNSWCCSTQCIFEDSELVVDSKFEAANAKKLLNKVFEKYEKVLKRLDGIVDTCGNQTGESIISEAANFNVTECSTPQYGAILSCIHQEIFKSCPDAKAEGDCQEVKDFMERCPMSQPPLKQNQQRSLSPAKDKLGDAMKSVIRNA